ncbi:hypothetical protein ACIQZG_07695 [Lysinibacillus sp. NPDC096418]|uniref:hypothetical protein n=1 Tax=Lysinibacillus sp. NPDC096418 TaxID=3364138 RepID=UPI00381DFB29
MNKELLLSLKDKVVRVDRGGPESRIGQLLSAEDDHFALLTEKDGVVYYKSQHIKSLTVNSKDGMDFNVEIPDDFEFSIASDFKSVVAGLKHQWVKVNRGGPEMLEGIMDDVTDDFITIISKDEIIRLALYHVRNISYGAKVESNDKNENKDNGNSRNKDNGNSRNKDGNSRNRRR